MATNIKKWGLTLALSFVAFRALSKSNKMKHVLENPEDRGCDKWGCGHFGAPRGHYKHQGKDFKVTPGETVFAPFTGKVVRYARPYANDPKYLGLAIESGRDFVKLFYFAPNVKPGQIITEEQPIGIAQDISEKYPGMIPHLHVEWYRDGVLIDPELIFNGK